MRCHCGLAAETPHIHLGFTPYELFRVLTDHHLVARTTRSAIDGKDTN
jgi:hypothetical protein